MKQFISILFIGIILAGTNSCDEESARKEMLDQIVDSPEGTVSSDASEQESERVKSPEDFVPEGYVLFEKILGDLNKDGKEDCVLIIKGTDKKRIVKDEYRGELDRNRRGLIVLFGKDKGFELVLKNKACFSSENEDGGVYYAPELGVSIKKGKLFIEYSHGRYGYWGYTFRFEKDDFALIGYDQSDNHGPIVARTVSYNFLTKQKQIKENINIDSENPEDEVFKETWEKLKMDRLVQLSEIKDFDEFSVER